MLATTAAPRGVHRKMPRAPPRPLPDLQNLEKTKFDSSGKRFRKFHHPSPSELGRPGLAAFADKYRTTYFRVELNRFAVGIEKGIRTAFVFDRLL